ncbi:MAG TPA: class II aldolase/adducin family protein [Herpetosiphonaceae bacterium]
MHDLSYNAIVGDLAEVGTRMTAIDAAEAAAGNISVFVRGLDGLAGAFHERGAIDLPVAASALAGGWVIVTGAGRRLRDVAATPETTICCLRIHDDGLRATCYAATEVYPTSELNSHLAIHDDHVARYDLAYHAVVHAQPVYLTYLSHIARYAETRALNRRLLRWQPETILTFPEGIATLPFQMPGSPEQAEVTAAAMRTYRAVVWQRHGIITRSEISARKAGDLVEYAETAARYEYLNLQAGEPSSGLSDAEMRLMCERWQIEQQIF